MGLIAYLTLAVIVGAQSGEPAQRHAVQQAVAQRHGSETRLTSVLISGRFAVVRGEGVHEGLRFSGNGWHVVCELGPGVSNSNALKRRCGFSAAAAMELSADEVANTAASAGEFTTAVSAERRAYRFAPPLLRAPEAARLQMLNQLNQQMQFGQITRAGAIRKWNELRFSLYLP
jgi:hypothetical protein